MDRAASNTLRTLGIIFTSIVMIVACGILLLLALCAGILAHSSQDQGTAFGLFLIAILFLALGIVVIVRLSRGLYRDTELSSETSFTPPSITPTFVLDSPPPSAPPTSIPPASPASTPAPLSPYAVPRNASRASTHVDPSHFSRASREAIQNLIYAIAALIAINLLTGFLPALGIRALGSQSIRPNPFSFVPAFGVFPYFLISRLLDVAPYIVLLVALRRAPGPRSFAYALVVPAIPAAWGLLSVPLLLLASFRAAGSMPFLILLPVALDVLIFYFAWIAIDRTGIHPPPQRLIIASVVIFLYRIFATALATALVIMAIRMFPSHKW